MDQILGLIESDQIIVLIESGQRMGLINLNQGMVLIKSNQYIQSWKMVRCSIMTDGKTLNYIKCICELSLKLKSEDWR